MSHLLHTIATFSLLLTTVWEQLLSMLEENLQHADTEVQGEAIEAMQLYWSRAEMTAEKKKQLLDRWQREVKHSSIGATSRGYALALASLPAYMLCATTNTDDTAAHTVYQPLADILTTLIAGSSQKHQADAETRRNAVQALTTIALAIKEDSALFSQHHHQHHQQSSNILSVTIYRLHYY